MILDFSGASVARTTRDQGEKNEHHERRTMDMSDIIGWIVYLTVVLTLFVTVVAIAVLTIAIIAN